jgi:Sulfotransferase family
MMPNFFIIGAHKSGTSALYHYLSQHPQIYMCPIKEPGFFFSDLWRAGNYRESAISTLEEYRALFQGVVNEVAVGEASTGYLYVPGVAQNISRTVPEAKLIAILRNPMDRAYSHYLMNIRDGDQWISSFSDALREDDRDVQCALHCPKRYKEIGFYGKQLKNYFDHFPREQIRVCLYDELMSDPLRTIQDCCRFLSVDDTFVPNMSHKPNVSGIPHRTTLHSLLFKSGRVKSLAKRFVPTRLQAQVRRIVVGLVNAKLDRPPLPSSIRSELGALYREDIIELQALIHCDLSGWLEG